MRSGRFISEFLKKIDCLGQELKDIKNILHGKKVEDVANTRLNQDLLNNFVKANFELAKETKVQSKATNFLSIATIIVLIVQCCIASKQTNIQQNQFLLSTNPSIDIFHSSKDKDGNVYLENMGLQDIRDVCIDVHTIEFIEAPGTAPQAMAPPFSVSVQCDHPIPKMKQKSEPFKFQIEGSANGQSSEGEVDRDKGRGFVNQQRTMGYVLVRFRRDLDAREYTFTKLFMFNVYNKLTFYSDYGSSETAYMESAWFNALKAWIGYRDNGEFGILKSNSEVK